MSTRNFYQTIGGVASMMALAFWGQAVDGVNDEDISGVNTAPQAPQVSVVTIPVSPSSNTEYAVSINGVSASVTSDSSATRDEVGNGLATALAAKAGIYGMATGSYASGLLTITGTTPGEGFLISVSGGAGASALSVSTTEAAKAAVVEFGRLLVSERHVTDENIPEVFVGDSSTLSKQVSALTVTHAANEVYLVDITCRGITRKVLVDAVTDSNATATAFADAINGVMDSDTVLAAAAGNIVTLTAEVFGQAFAVSHGVKSGTLARLALAHTTIGGLSDIADSFIGISLRRGDTENQTFDGDDPAYGPNEGVVFRQRGRLYVQRDLNETISPYDDIYVGLAGSEKGRLFKTASPDRAYLPMGFIRWERGERTGENHGIQRVRIKQVA